MQYIINKTVCSWSHNGQNGSYNLPIPEKYIKHF